jgi:hypothetical protein
MVRFRELVDEFKQIVLARAGVLDAFLPPVLFLLIRLLLGFTHAIAAAFVSALIVGIFRLRRGQPVYFALAGTMGVVLAALLSTSAVGESGYYLPGIVSGVVTALVGLISVLIRKPLVAWTSFLARRWPLDWYWHPEVRPAYTEVTLAWTVYFGVRSALQASFFEQGSPIALAVLNFASGWPGTILLLIASYLYGSWRLVHLKGPSVEEFVQAIAPPWTSQRRGF